MLIPTIVLGVLAVAFLIYGYVQGQGAHIAGTKVALTMTWQVIPLLVFAFLLAGMVQVLIPQEAIAKWVGAESGFRGILIGSVAGAFTPGGPFVSMPIAAGLLRTGAGIGTMVAFLTGWSLIAVIRMPLEVGIMGWKFTAIRAVTTFFFAPIAGWLAQLFFGNVKLP
jgi:uncharacterized protein